MSELNEKELLYSCEDFSVCVDGTLCQIKEKPLMDIIYELALAYKRKEQELKNEKEAARNELEIYDQACLDLRNELEETEHKFLCLQTKHEELKKNPECFWGRTAARQAKRADRYMQALEEINPIAIKSKKDICNNCGWHNTDNCNPEDYTCGDFIKIQDIIYEALRNE